MKKWRGWFAGSAKAPGFELPIDLASDAFFADPTPVYAWLRATHPVAPVAGGGFVVSRHADVSAAMTNRALGNAPSRFSALNAKNAAKYSAASLVSNIPPFLDAPDHIPVRKALSSAFHGVFREAEGWVPELAKKHVARTGVVDLVAEVARPFACEVMSRFLGLELSRPDIKDATGAFFRLFAPIKDPAIFAQTNASIDAARALLRTAPELATPGLVQALRGTGMDEAQVIDCAYLILADGIENIEAGAVLAFDIIHHSGLSLGAETEWAAFVQEALRLETPAQILPRVAQEDTVLQGVEISAGMPVFLALGSANRDPAAFDTPDSFDPGRAGVDAMTFGKGRHSCIGAGLAQLQITALVKELFNKNVRPKSGQEITFQHRFGHRWPNGYDVFCS